MIPDDKAKREMYEKLSKFIAQHCINENNVKKELIKLPGGHTLWEKVNNLINGAQAVGQGEMLYGGVFGERLDIANPIVKGEMTRLSLDEILGDIQKNKKAIKKLKIPDGKENRNG